MYGLKNVIATATCYKNPEKVFNMDLILTISWSSFQCSCVIETGLSNFHQTVTVMKTTIQKLKPKISYCRNYKCIPMINLEQKFCPEYQKKTLITQVMFCKPFYRSSSVSCTSLLLRRTHTLKLISCFHEKNSYSGTH